MWLLMLAQEVDLSKYDPACGVMVEREGDTLRAGPLAIRLSGDRPLLEALGPARDVRPQFSLAVGSRKGTGYIFFDSPAKRPFERHAAKLDLKSARVESAGRRVLIALSKYSAGPFSGELVFHLYAGSPLVLIEAALGQPDPQVAYAYDAVLEGAFKTVAWKNLQDQIERVEPRGEWRPVAVRNRAIFGEVDGGTLAVLPPPHAFFFPRDYTPNLKFAQVGAAGFGLRQDLTGGGNFVPWFDAPAGKVQRMGMFVWIGSGGAEGALEGVKKYTHGDAFKPMEGRVTFTSHWHCRPTINDMAGKPVGPEVVRVFKAMGVQIVHLAEFHGDGHPDDPGPLRLAEMQAMFDTCRKYSDADLLFIPGEEANHHFGGHWMYMFPKPVTFTFKGGPFEDGKAYRVTNKDQMTEVLRREKGLAWTSHPRIKSSAKFPDAYREADFYKDDLWLGAAWKSMPGDLSDGRLGVRCLDLLDDMNTWGQKKQMLGEVDVFEIDRSHELYGHMNINYLKLAKVPPADDWSAVPGVLRRGDFFVTTGEVLIHSFEVGGGRAKADVEWTFPLGKALIASWDGKTVTRRAISLAETGEFGRKTFEWPVPEARWVRLEVWDVAANGAFTQPVTLER